MKTMNIYKTFMTISSLCVLLCNVSVGDDTIFAADSQSKWQKSLIKQGFYRSLGFYSGYYHYGEVDTRRNNERVMRMDLLMLGLMGQMGFVSQRGVKLEGTLRLNYALGKYTGGILDADNPDRNGQSATSIDGASIADIELKGGYNLLRSLNATLYFQTGLGYYLNRNELITMKRIQGYFYVPLELEGETLLTSRIALTYGGGYRYFIFGNHFTENATTERGNLRVTQKEGFGLSAFIGANFFTKTQELRSLRLVYEYWKIGDSERRPVTSVYTNVTHYFYEPKNSTHRVFIQYSFGF
ncbi:hypothetical protein OQH61_02380 [Helicobacter sp. MIT 21-1697]|uniref:hypothetical protein n=1 Tax=Helicobacter sp. MIT 21-1697 TaxID=2993733 RepID=UPI00224AB754|nr:hypothetical protein [Helicobacter sp. MIT 21-1697]MCX2716577.1 hypothetical protein [Helicobacter sp. MIT 21-1697]